MVANDIRFSHTKTKGQFSKEKTVIKYGKMNLLHKQKVTDVFFGQQQYARSFLEKYIKLFFIDSSFQ